MARKCRFTPVILFLLSALFLSLNFVDITWADTVIPLPQNTTETKREKRLIAGMEFDFVYCISTLESAKIKDFYRKKLADLGWTEKDLVKDMQGVPDIQIDTSLMQTLGQNLTFTQKDEQLILNFLPSAYSTDNKTRFTLCHGRVPEKAIDVSSPQSLMPKLLAVPKKDVAPTYPGATLTTLSEQADSLKAGYFSNDDIESVISFYKGNMSGYGWELVEERPLEKRRADEFVGQNVQEYCPSCSSNIADIPSLELQFGQLTFANETGDVCKIVLSNASSGPEAKPPIMLTTILVYYNEKKK